MTRWVTLVLCTGLFISIPLPHSTGIADNRPHMLLGIVVRVKSKKAMKSQVVDDAVTMLSQSPPDPIRIKEKDKKTEKQLKKMAKKKVH